MSGGGERAERVGLLGGTFDPVHVGHVVAGVQTRAALHLDRMLLVVAGDPWQKRRSVVASPADRLAMVEAATRGVERLEACALEVERPGPTYSADTLRALARPGRELFLVVGADVPERIHTWRDVDTIRELATLVVVDRDGSGFARPAGRGWRVERVAVTRLDVSSTDLRARLARGDPIDGLVPPEVVRLISERHLYTRPR